MDGLLGIRAKFNPRFKAGTSILSPLSTVTWPLTVLISRGFPRSVALANNSRVHSLILAMSKVEPESTINRIGPDSTLADAGLKLTRTRLPSDRPVGRLHKMQFDSKHGKSLDSEKRIALRPSLDSGKLVGQGQVRPWHPLRVAEKEPHSGNPSVTDNGTHLIS